MQQQQQQDFDENLYSRQVAVLGAETQAKLVKLNVFIHGLRGLGVEVAKNLILAGPRSVFIHDEGLVTINDLGSNFYTREQHVGNVSRADASLAQLKELNPYVTVEVYKGPLTPAALSEQFQVVVLTDVWDKHLVSQINEAVRAKNGGFIFAHSSGLFGSTFVDFSDKFAIHDPTGEEPKSTIIAGITQDVDGVVTTSDEKRHGFEDNDFVTFREVLGMTEVNEKEFQIKVKSPYTFTIGDTSAFGLYQREGIAIQVKKKQEIAFKSFAASLTHPIAPGRQELDLVDWEKIGRPELLHVTLNALFQFAQLHGALPELNNEDHAEQVWKLAQEINASERGEGAVKAELDEQIVKNVARHARAQITPTTSFWGGVIAQEIVKFTGKFTPIRQWLHADFFEALPNGPQDRTLQGKQYDDYIAIFGRDLLAKLQNSKAFMVGAGALGCEYIKMFSLIGLGSGPDGLVNVTDDDNIEISNLNRQFLFRKHNVGHNKAAVATSVGATLNPSVKFKSYTLRVGKENEPVFHDQFWESLNLVINAVDNVHARRYIDYQCCYYQKPLFESGTLGTKCNSQLILPNQTQSYSESQDPPEETIPLCTLKNFPYQIEHTIQWARDYFQGVFADGSIECIKYLENPKEYIRKTNVELRNQPGVLRPRLQTIKKYVEISRAPTYEKCVELARNIFEDVFHNQIHQLLYCFPLDHRTEEGQIFWSNPKRPPTPLKFDINDETHLELVQSGANIYAHMYKLPYEHDKAKVREIIKNVKVEEFQVKNVTIKASEKDTKEERAEDDEQLIEQLSKDLSELQITQKELNEIVFEKDDPTNWHIEFLAAVANLRARNYKIKEVPPFTVKLIAGKIIPALATTTAMIVGAVGIEIFKYIQGKEVEKMRNSFINLALPLFLFSEPLPPGKHEDQANNVIYLGPTKAIPPKWTAWDRITVTGNKTIAEFLQYFKQTYDVVVTSITVGQFMIFSSYPPPTQETLNSKLEDAYVKAVGQPLPPYRRFLDLTVGGDIDVNGVDTNADFAPVKYQYQ